jgi:hypothetical protein
MKHLWNDFLDSHFYKDILIPTLRIVFGFIVVTCIIVGFFIFLKLIGINSFEITYITKIFPCNN